MPFYLDAPTIAVVIVAFGAVAASLGWSETQAERRAHPKKSG